MPYYMKRIESQFNGVQP